MMIHCWATLF